MTHPTDPLSPAGLDRLVTVEADGSLTLPRAVREGLGLLRAERFVVFSEGRHLLSLIAADAGPQSLAAAHRLALSGAIEGFGLADLFSLLNMTRRSGLLLVVSDPLQKSIRFRNGEIVGAASNVAKEQLGQVLYRTGKLSQEALQEAERQARAAPDKRFGTVLLERKLLDPATLAWALRHQAEEIVYSVFRLGGGSFFLFDGELSGEMAGDEAMPVAIDTQNVLMESFQRLDELGLIAQHIHGQTTVLRPTGKALQARASDRYRRVLDLLDGVRTVEEIVRATGWGEFTTSKVLYRLIKAGVVEARDEPVTRATADPALAALAALVERYDRALHLLRDVLQAKAVDVDLPRVAEAFLRSASNTIRAIFRGVSLGTRDRLPAELLLANLETLGNTDPEPQPAPGDRRLAILGRALAEWTAFQSLVVRNLLPAAEATELLSYVRAIERSNP